MTKVNLKYANCQTTHMKHSSLSFNRMLRDLESIGLNFSPGDFRARWLRIRSRSAFSIISGLTQTLYLPTPHL